MKYHPKSVQNQPKLDDNRFLDRFGAFTPPNRAHIGPTTRTLTKSTSPLGAFWAKTGAARVDLSWQITGPGPGKARCNQIVAFSFYEFHNSAGVLSTRSLKIGTKIIKINRKIEMQPTGHPN